MTARTARLAQYIYDSQALVAVIEPVEGGGWRLIRNGREIGVFPTRQAAIKAIDDA